MVNKNVAFNFYIITVKFNTSAKLFYIKIPRTRPSWIFYSPDPSKQFLDFSPLILCWNSIVFYFIFDTQTKILCTQITKDFDEVSLVVSQNLDE